MARLYRITDGKLKIGGLSQAISWDENGNMQKINGHKPMVGCSLLVGSILAKTEEGQEYWLTGIITEIVEDRCNYIRFKTVNSEYEWFTENIF